MIDRLNDHIAWLRNTHTAVSDAIDDYKYQRRTQNIVYVAFDPSIIFAPLALRHKAPNIENSDDWLDIAADIVFWNQEILDIDRFGYQLVMPHATYLTVLYNYKIDIDFFESIENSADIDDIFYKLNARISDGNSSYSIDAYRTLDDFLIRADKRHKRLERLLSYIKSGKIVLENSVFDASEMKRTRITKEEFDDLYMEINKLRSEPHKGTPREMFTKAIEVIGIIDNKKKTEELVDGRYLFLAWPKSRSYYKVPKQYHRLITTLMIKIMAMRTDQEVFLIDLRENISYLLRKIRESIGSSRSISDLNKQNILNVYESIIGFMDDEMKKIFNADGARHSVNRDLNSLSMREIVGVARHAKSRTRKTLEELGEEFRIYETVAGWDDLPDDHPIKVVVENAKPAP